jgi:hypothetical protein
VGVNASVSPRPPASRSAATDWAMNQEVPQPTTAIRAPAAGSASRASAPMSAAVRHISG